MKNGKRVLSLGGFAMLMVIIFYWIINIKQGRMPYFDQWNRELVPLFAGTPIYTVFRWITELGSKSFVLPLSLVMTIVLWLWYKDFRPALLFGFGTLGAHLLNTGIKELVARERPSVSVVLDAQGYSFPSGHAMVSMVCYGLLAFLISKKCRSQKLAFTIQISFACLILLIGMSRYIINVHYLTDIIAGFFFGFIVLVSLLYFYQSILIQKNKKK